MYLRLKRHQSEKKHMVASQEYSPPIRSQPQPLAHQRLTKRPSYLGERLPPPPLHERDLSALALRADAEHRVPEHVRPRVRLHAEDAPPVQRNDCAVQDRGASVDGRALEVGEAEGGAGRRGGWWRDWHGIRRGVVDLNIGIGRPGEGTVDRGCLRRLLQRWSR